MDKMNLDEMIEKLENPNVDAFTCFTYELAGFLKELRDSRELIRRQAEYISAYIDTERNRRV